MQDYDVTLKLLLRRSATATMLELTGSAIERWIDVELPKIQNRRVDLLGETGDGKLVHIELQSTNDTGMPLRMAEYALGVFRQFSRFPRQIALYVGESDLRMETRLSGPGLAFEYELIDARDLDGHLLLESAGLSDNVLAVLTRLRDRQSAVREIIRKVSDAESQSRDLYLEALLILAGLRGLEELVQEEARKMPILNDILEHKVLGREFKKGREQGLEQGLEQGRQGEALRVLQRLIERRFGAIPSWVEQQLISLPAAELEDLSVRLLDAVSLEDLLK